MDNVFGEAPIVNGRWAPYLRAMQTVTTLEIDRPAAEVFAFIADFENNPSWQGGMRSCRWTTDGPIRVGSTYAQEASFLSRTILTTFEVVAYEPGRSISIRSVVSTFPIQVTRTVEPLGGHRCRVTADVQGQPPWYFRLPGMAWLVARSVAGDYARLKRQLEAA